MASASLLSRTALAMSATVAIASSCAPRIAWMSARSSAGGTFAPPRTGAPSGELRSAMTGGAVRSEAGARLMVSTPRLAGGHLQGDGGRVLVAHDDFLRDRAEPLLPGLQRIAPGREAPQLEVSRAVGQRVVGMLGHHDPAAHPGVEVARHANDLGLLEGDGDRAALRLRPVEGRVGARRAVQVVQKPVAVQEVDP